jgi:hypothetical protein
MSRYGTDPAPADRARIRALLELQGVESPFEDPSYVVGYLGSILRDLTEVDDRLMAKRIAHGRALLELVDEDAARVEALYGGLE